MKYGVLFDENHYIDNLSFDKKEAEAYRVRLWDAPEPSCVVCLMLPGSRVEIIGEEEDHYQVRTGDGREGWLGKLQIERRSNR